MPVNDRMRYEIFAFLMKYHYSKIVLEESTTLSYEEQRLLDCFMEDKVVKKISVLMKMLRYILKYGEKFDIQIKPLSILCRHHLKKVKKTFNIDSESTLDLYYNLSSKVIIKINNIERLFSVNALYNCPETLPILKEKNTLTCIKCKNMIDYKIDDNHYIIDDTYIYCENMNSFLCKNCFLDSNISTIYNLDNEDICL